ncbi:MAG: hypothetical protein WCQ66_06850 [Sphaerochaetaceae bacterium]|jgi:adenylate kinase family enzyme
MRIAIIGYSCSGKSTLAEHLGKRYGIPVLHLDAVHFLPDWKERSEEKANGIVSRFLATNEQWVIDGNYRNLCYRQRLNAADRIYVLLFPRLACLGRAIRRFRRYRGKSREDVGKGCVEKLDAPFLFWVLWKGRNGKHRRHYGEIISAYRSKAIVIRTQRRLSALKEKEP